jgi:hypothetical protein
MAKAPVSYLITDKEKTELLKSVMAILEESTLLLDTAYCFHQCEQQLTNISMAATAIKNIIEGNNNEK